MITSESTYYRNLNKDLDEDLVTDDYKNRYKNGPGFGLIFNKGYSIIHVIFLYFLCYLKHIEQYVRNSIKGTQYQ